MNSYKEYFTLVIRKNFPTQSEGMLLKTDFHYKNIAVDSAFAATSSNPIDKRLDFCSYFLALIKTLDDQGENFETIRKNCLEIVSAYVQPKNRFHAFMKRLVPKLINTWIGNRLITKFNERVSHNSNPQGFIANVITDKNETYGLGFGIDILECGICKLFRMHDYSKYAPILCEVDEITSGLAGLKLIRTGTIANGASKCDFRFKKV